jgi:NADPH:quinone reductase-like Zn-dependent oxidoreductase
MKALMYSGNAAQPVVFGEVAQPAPAANQSVVAVEAFSVNRGDVFALRGTYGSVPEIGSVPGQDVAGVVLRAAADGSGPAVGTRVVGRASGGGWAEQAAVSSAAIAPLPEGIDAVTAAALPLAGITALRLVRTAGEIAGRRLLITGAGGGVGHYAVELAAAAGALVTAVAVDARAAARLAELGAHHVVDTAAQAQGPFDVVLESVGGQEFSDAVAGLAAGGLVIWFGQASLQPVTLDFFSFLRSGVGFTLRHFANFVSDTTDAEDLATLSTLVALGRLHPEIARIADWADTASVLTDLMDRKIPGKAVLRIDRASR